MKVLFPQVRTKKLSFPLFRQLFKNLLSKDTTKNNMQSHSLCSDLPSSMNFLNLYHPISLETSSGNPKYTAFKEEKNCTWEGRKWISYSCHLWALSTFTDIHQTLSKNRRHSDQPTQISSETQTKLIFPEATWHLIRGSAFVNWR